MRVRTASIVGAIVRHAFLALVMLLVLWPIAGFLTGARFGAVSWSMLVRPFVNSLLVSLATTILAIAAALGAGHAFARHRFAARSIGLTIALVALFAPVVLVIVAHRWLAGSTTPFGSLVSVVLAHSAIAVPVSIWLLSRAFARVPVELEESARLDGVAPLAVFHGVSLPLAKAHVSGVAALVFALAWGELPVSQVILTSPEAQTLPVVLAALATTRAWGLFVAATFVAMIPAVIAGIYAVPRIAPLLLGDERRA